MKRKWQIGNLVTLVLFSVFFLLPIIYTVSNSFMSSAEINGYYGTGSAEFHLIPDDFTLEAYKEILWDSPFYLVKFWISILLSVLIVIGQLFVSVTAGYAFAKFEFWGRDVLFFIVITVMMMPYQVTLVSNYIVLDGMGLIGTYAALVLPAVFSPFGVFLMRQMISAMPTDIIEAARLDGAGELMILWKIVLPYSKSGVTALVVLSFIDSWNMVEQPIVFLNNPYRYPLSIFLSQVSANNPGAVFACGVLAMLPVLLLFAYCKDDMIRGIRFTGLK